MAKEEIRATLAFFSVTFSSCRVIACVGQSKLGRMMVQMQTQPQILSVDADSFHAIYDRYFPGIYAYIFRLVPCRAEAEDLAAQTFFKALNYLWRFRWSGISLSAWLYRIATNEVNSYFRRQKKLVSLDGDDQAGHEHNNGASHLEQREQDKALLVLKTQLRLALANLKPEQRTLIALRYFEKKSYAEISQITGKRISVLKMRLHRALKKLKLQLEQKGASYAAYRECFDEIGGG